MKNVPGTHTAQAVVTHGPVEVADEAASAELARSGRVASRWDLQGEVVDEQLGNM